MARAIEGLRPCVKVSLTLKNSDGQAVFGHGVAQLCQGVEDAGSLNAAAKSMGMAYSKAWRIVKDAEAAFGVQLLVRDGARGSTLTPEGKFLVETYERLRDEAAAHATGALAKIVEEAATKA